MIFEMKNALFCLLCLSFAVMSAGALAQNPGSLDLSFDPGSGANSDIYAIAIQSDGKIIIGGQFTSYNGIPRSCISRLNSDGSLDQTFNPGAGASWIVMTVAIQSDNKIIIGGVFWSYAGTQRNGIARLNPDGSLDTTFDPGSGVSGGSFEPGVFATAIQNDGKIVIGGAFAYFNGVARNHIARLNPNGSLDTTFGGWGGGADVLAIAIQNDGNIMIGGLFGYKIRRLSHIDGSIDSTFDFGSGIAGSAVRSIAILADGRMLLGGSFWSYNGIARSNIARVNADGTLDMTFEPSSGSNSEIDAIAVQSDGRIVIGGYFTTYDGTPMNKFARLNVDGSLDTAFDVGAAIQGTIVLSMAIQNDGRIIIGGWFDSYEGIPRGQIARILNDLSTSAPFAQEQDIILYPNPSSSHFSILIPGQLGRSELVLRNAVGEEVLHVFVSAGRNEVPLTNLAPGLYAADVTSSAGRRTQWLVVE